MFENFPLLANGFALAISPYNIMLMMVGVFLGILVGVLPGLGAPNGVTLLMPLTFGMNPVSAIILLTSMYWGALYGGSTTSILFNIPGEPSSVATTFDEAATLHGANFVGSPQQVVEKILFQHEIFHHDRFLVQFSVGTLPHDKLIRSIELLGTQVAPAVRAALGATP